MDSVTTIPDSPAERYILRISCVEQQTGFKRAFIYRLMRKGRFPQAKRIGMRAVGWDSVEVEQWIAARLSKSA